MKANDHRARGGSNGIPRIALALALACVSGAAIGGPGTQTEDDIYVGKKRQARNAAETTVQPGVAGVAGRPVQGFKAPGTATPQPRAGAGVSPNTGLGADGKKARSGGDDDLDDLEVERRKVQGVNTPGTTTPLPRAGAGTSPNTGRVVAPSALPAPAPALVRAPTPGPSPLPSAPPRKPL